MFHSSKNKKHRSQSPNETRWRSINLDVIDDDDDDDEGVFSQEVKAEFEQLAGERWTYAIFWEAERSGDFSPARGFYNVDDHKFKDKAITFFQLRDSCSETVAFVSFLDLVFRTGNPIWLLGVDDLASSLYFQARQGYQYGLQTLFWIGVDQGVMEFGSTELIDWAWITYRRRIWEKKIGSYNGPSSFAIFLPKFRYIIDWQ